jgi:hypothetical protein
MKKKFTLLLALIMVISIAVFPGGATAQDLLEIDITEEIEMWWCCGPVDVRYNIFCSGVPLHYVQEIRFCTSCGTMLQYLVYYSVIDFCPFCKD